MKRISTIAVPAVLVAVALAIGVFFVLRDSKPATAAQVVVRYELANQKLAASLGPNTTFHQVIADRKADRQQELWISFDGAGFVSGWWVRETRLSDGLLLQQTELQGGELVTTDIATGRTRSIQQATGSVAGLAKNLGDAVIASQDVVDADAAAPVQSLDGHSVYVVKVVSKDQTNIYLIDKSTYLVLRQQTITQNKDGTVTITADKDYPVLEVLHGKVAPSTTPQLVPTVTPTPTETPAPGVSATVPPTDTTTPSDTPVPATATTTRG